MMRAREEMILAALISSPTIADVAARCGVGESTVRRWLTKPHFRARVTAARRAVLSQAIAGTVAALGDALATLRRNLTCGSPGAEIRAATAIIDAAVWGEDVLTRLTDLDDLARRVAELEAAKGGRTR